jgi:hypothetical protein
VLKSFLKVLPITALALFTLFHYTMQLRTDPYTRFYRVQFQVVSGLNKKSRVMARGVTVGKVKEIILDDAKSSVVVVMKVLPDFMIFSDDSDSKRMKRGHIKVVPQNAFGLMRIEVEAGVKSAANRLFNEADIIEGENPEPSAFTDLIKRRDPAINDFFADLANATADWQDPESGLGRFLTDEFLAHDLHQVMIDTNESTSRLANSLRQLEFGEGSIGQFLSANPDVEEDIRDQLYAIKEALADARESMGLANSGQAGFGQFIHDVDTVSDLRVTSTNIRSTTASWSGPESWLTNTEAATSLAEGAESLANAVSDLNSSEGTSGGLISDRDRARTFEESLEEIRNGAGELRRGEGSGGAFFVDGDNRDILEEVLNRVYELAGEAREGVQSGVADQPVNTIHGAVFSIF